MLYRTLTVSKSNLLHQSSLLSHFLPDQPGWSRLFSLCFFPERY